MRKPFYKRKWFIVLVILLVLGGIGAAMGGGDTDTGEPTNTATEEKQEVKAEDSVEKEPAKEEAPKEPPAPKMTTAQENAYKAAKNYIDVMPFSRQGLINQLSSEYGDQYDSADAEFAVSQLEKNGEVDWNAEAYEAAKNYLDTMSFSKQGLIEQLESEYGDGFTHEQAVYGADKAYQ